MSRTVLRETRGESPLVYLPLPLPGLVRMSLGLYNNYKEIDIFLECLDKIVRNKNYYKEKYKKMQ